MSKQPRRPADTKKTPPQTGASQSVAEVLGLAISVIGSVRPGDRSPKDRKYSMLKTQLEFIQAFAKLYEL